MTTPLSKPFAALLALGLLLPQAAVVQACLHGATGLEQTGIMRGNAREEKLVGRWDGRSKSILKLFVGPAGALPQISTLSAEALKEHADLARVAAGIDSEGTRGGIGSSEYMTKSGVIVKVADVTGRDWSSIAEQYGVPAAGDKKLGSLPLWLNKVREEHRALYAVSIDMSAALQNQDGARDAYALAVTFQYPDGATAAVLEDKWLEYWSSWGVPVILKFESGEGLAAQMNAIVARDPDINDPKPVPVTLVPNDYGGDGASDVVVKLGSASYAMVKIRGDAVYFKNPNIMLTPRSGGAQSAQNEPPAVPKSGAPHINMADIQAQAQGL